MKRRIINFILAAISLAGLIYLFALAYIYFSQSQLLYQAYNKKEQADIPKLAINDLRIKANDGTLLQIWYLPPQKNMPVFLFFHGQGASLESGKWRYYRLRKNGFGFLALAYRGFSSSEGAPSEKGLFLDGLAAYDFLISQGIKPNDIIIHGHSLGSGVATYVAAKRKARALILEAPFSSALDVAKSRLKEFPVDLLMRDKFENSKYIKDVHTPLLVVHGDKDEVIPIQFGKKLFESANSPKSFILIKNGNHNDLTKLGVYKIYFEFLGFSKADYAKEIVINE